MFSVEHASSMGGGGGQQASCLVAKQAVEFPQVLASKLLSSEKCLGVNEGEFIVERHHKVVVHIDSYTIIGLNLV